MRVYRSRWGWPSRHWRRWSWWAAGPAARGQHPGFIHTPRPVPRDPHPRQRGERRLAPAADGQVHGPAFIAQTGDEYQNQSAGSVGLAQEIAAGEITPNVFVPIGSAAMALVEPAFTTWAVQFAASPLVVAYYPQGPYAPELKKISEGKLPITDLFTLMATPGFKLGRTDPATDPQGQGFVEMVGLAQQYLGVSATTASAVLGGTDAAPRSSRRPRSSRPSRRASWTPPAPTSPRRSSSAFPTSPFRTRSTSVTPPTPRSMRRHR